MEADSICVFPIIDSGYIRSIARKPRISFIWLYFMSLFCYGTITLKDEQGKYYDPYLTDEEKLKVIVLQVT